MPEEMNMENMERPEAADQTERTGAENESGKIFTQEEVDKIVEKRLNRERKKFSALLNEVDPREAALEERERALTIRELQADVKGILNEKNIPMEALELINYKDKESCYRSIEALETVIIAATNKRIERIIIGGRPPKMATQESTEDNLRDAFGLR